MAPHFCLAAIIIIPSLFLALSSASPGQLPPPAVNACKVSSDPPTCVSELATSGLKTSSDPTAVQIIHAAMKVSSDKLGTAKSKVEDIRKSSAGNHNMTVAADTCLELYGYVEHRATSAGVALDGGEIKDARAWMSAAFAYQYDCWSALKYVNETSQVNDTMAYAWAHLLFTGDVLGMLANYDQKGGDTSLWGPTKTERNGFWEKTEFGSGPAVVGGVPSGLTASVTVCKTNKTVCNHQKVQDAVDAAPTWGRQKFVILIKAGLYEEIVRVPFNKTNVVFVGDGMGKTIITGDLNVGIQLKTTYHTATVGVNGDGFMAKNLTIKNTAGIGAHQAVALRLDSDHSIIESCEFIGNQDTLYAHSLRQYYKHCHIQGNVDFIFGNSAAVFQDCTISVAPRQQHPEKADKATVTAHAKLIAAQTTGFVFLNSIINGTEDYMRFYAQQPDKFNSSFLGRPWKEYSRTVFIDCTLGDLISREGWEIWDANSTLSNLYYGEVGSKNAAGKTVDTTKRVPWSSQIDSKNVPSFYPQNFIQATKWFSNS